MLTHSLLGESLFGQVVCLFRVRILGQYTKDGKVHFGRFAAIRPFKALPLTIGQRRRGMPLFEWDTERNLSIVRIGAVQRAACIVPVVGSMRSDAVTMANSKAQINLWSYATKFILNTKVDLETFNVVYDGTAGIHRW